VQRYLPYELPWALSCFLLEVRPALGVVMETEVWPNLLAATRAAGVPVMLANARLSEKSLTRALRLRALMTEAARGFTLVLAQAAADAERMRRLYDGRLEVVGNLKFDLEPSAELVAAGRRLRAGWGERPVWLCASTREGEETLILDALAARGGPGVALVCIVPRHPQRFDEVARLIEARGWRALRRSQGWREGPGADALLLGDTMGEMALYYAAADVALIGGSLLPFGAQNLIEACAVGTPVVLGPSVYNFAQVAQDALAAGAAEQVADAAAALQAMAGIGADPARRAVMHEAALAFARAHRGATRRTVARALELLTASAAR
jgi:3-deoxy-D-manno-octulosonic-acid transferase